MAAAPPGPMTGKVAVVTGSSRGIGKQVAIRLARLGAQVVLAARTTEARASTPGTLGDTAAEIEQFGLAPLVVAADLADPSDVDALVAAPLERFGGVDILVNNAGYTVGRAIYAHAPNILREQWEKVVAVNLSAPLMLTQGYWDSMRERGGGRVVNVTSGSATMQEVGTQIQAPGMDAIGPLYAASKAALNRMMNILASEAVPHGIAVITVEPGFVLTETMATSNERAGVTETTAISSDIPAAAITHLCTCADPWPYVGPVIAGPELTAALGLT